MKHPFAIFLALLAGGASAQVTCTQLGNFTQCSDGTTMERIGNEVRITRPQQAPATVPLVPPPTPLPSIQLQPTPPSLLRDIANPQQRRCGYTQTGQYVCI